jgi:aerotaxis receptor
VNDSKAYVDGKEYILTERDLLISKTDLNSIITYVSDDLIRVSGFSKEEMLGSPHNIFRHPDMPKIVFAGLWKTIKQGVVWSGLVKNKTKSGGFYWVMAVITPIREHGKTIGYMSVRNKPNRKDVENAAKEYAEMRAGRNWSLDLFK